MLFFSNEQVWDRGPTVLGVLVRRSPSSFVFLLCKLVAFFWTPLISSVVDLPAFPLCLQGNPRPPRQRSWYLQGKNPRPPRQRSWPWSSMQWGRSLRRKRKRAPWESGSSRDSWNGEMSRPRPSVNAVMFLCRRRLHLLRHHLLHRPRHQIRLTRRMTPAGKEKPKNSKNRRSREDPPPRCQRESGRQGLMKCSTAWMSSCNANSRRPGGTCGSWRVAEVSLRGSEEVSRCCLLDKNGWWWRMCMATRRPAGFKRGVSWSTSCRPPKSQKS